MSIDSIYERIIAELKTQSKIQNVSRELQIRKKNDERVLYVYDIIKGLNGFHSPLDVTKCDYVSTYYRNLGNKCFQKSEYYKAWQYYNLALLNAPLDSEKYCTALSNRSAVFSHLEKYEECLQDIQEIFSMKYPDQLKDKLIKRQEACKKILAKNKKNMNKNTNLYIDNLLTLKEPKHETYLGVSAKLDVDYTVQLGRHVIANEDIQVGEVLVQEDPYFVLLLKSQYLFSCNYCLSRKLNLLPCHKCCFILYCSEQCKNNAWKDYHAVECSLMATLLAMKFTKLELLALRTVIKARNDHTSWDNLFTTIKEAEQTMIPSEDQDKFPRNHGQVKIQDKWLYSSKYYASIHTLETNETCRHVSDIFQKCVSAAVFLYLLSEGTTFLNTNEGDGESIQKCVAGLLLLHMMTSPTNMHGLSANIQNADGNYVDEVSLASAPYAFHSLLNHSCVPNVVRFNKLGTGQMTLIALSPIKKGMQLFDNYGSHYALHDLETRRDNLKRQYKFLCSCEACENNWPQYVNMKPTPNLSFRILMQKESLLSSDVIDKLQQGDKNTAMKLFRPLCKLIEDLDSYKPCPELADCQEALKQCLAIIEGLVPYGYSQLVEWEPLVNRDYTP